MIFGHDKISVPFSCEIQIISVEFVQKQRREEYHNIPWRIYLILSCKPFRDLRS